MSISDEKILEIAKDITVGWLSTYHREEILASDNAEEISKFLTEIFRTVKKLAKEK